MDVVTGARETLRPDLYSKVAHYRHRIFVERLGWQLQTKDGGELDQFDRPDRPDTIYVIAQNDEGQVIGCARLLPTLRPYLLSDIFPQLLNGMEPPRSPEVWELSRFSAVDLKRPPAHRSAPVLLDHRRAIAEGIPPLRRVVRREASHHRIPTGS